MRVVKKCSNCNSKHIAGDKYCRFCGAPLKAKVCQESDICFADIYGPPPIARQHICRSCGYSWKTFYMLDDNEKWCPNCGGEAPGVENDF